MKIHLQHIWGFWGTLFLLALLINAKPAFLLDSSLDSAAIDAAGCFDRTGSAMAFGGR
jgi:hypothetical protein